MTKYTAIITDVRYRMSLAIIRDLAEAGINVIAVEHDNKTAPLGFYSKYIKEKYFLNKENYLDELFDLCKKQYEKNGYKPVLIPVSTATMNLLVDEEQRKRFEDVSSFLLSSKENLCLLNDKEKLHSLAIKLGIPVPTEFEMPVESANYPLVVKPLFGEKYGLKASDRYKIVRTDDELNKAYNLFKDICKGESPIIQKYLEGFGYGCSILAKDGEIVSFIMHKRIREYPVTGGPSACCEVVSIEKIKEYSKQIIKEINFSGICMFEYKEDENGELYLLEANPRVWGSYPLTRCAKSGFSLSWFIESFNQGNDEDCDLKVSTNTVKVRMHFILSDLKAGIGYLKKGNTKEFLDSILDVFRPSTKGGLFEWNDLGPSIKYLSSKVK